MMKRPLFYAAVIVLSGVVCGIRETGLFMKLTAVTVMAVMMVMIKSGVSKTDAPLFLTVRIPVRGGRLRITLTMLLAAAAAVLFAAGLARARCVSRRYDSAACRSFFEQQEATNPGQFDYALYLKSLGICGSEQYEKRKDGPDAEKEPLMYLLDRTGDYLETILDVMAAEQDAGIYKAVILGRKDGMEESVRDLYQNAGIAHLLAVSGLHVSMIGAGLCGLLRKKWTRGRASAAASVLIFLYMLLTGASGSAVRAVIMLLCGFAAAAGGRKYDLSSALSLSAVILMLWRPYQIMTAGFQLSFGAVAAVGPVSTALTGRLELLLENAGSRTPGVKRIRKKNRLPASVKVFAASACVQLITLPVITYHYFRFPLYGILLNLIVIPLMAAVLGSGLALMGLGLVRSALAAVIAAPGVLRGTGTHGLPAAGAVVKTAGRLPEILTPFAAAPGHYVLKLYEYLAGFSLKLPFASVCLGRPAAEQAAVYYLLLAGAFILITRRGIGKRRELIPRCAALLLAAMLCPSVLRHFEPDSFYVIALDVGQGDAFLIGNGRTHILVDGGSSGRKSVGERVMEPLLLSKGICHLDMIIVSHPDADHINGILYLLGPDAGINADRLVLPGPAEGNAAYGELIRAFGGSGKICYLTDGQRIAGADDFEMKCIYAGTYSEDTNRQSSVILLRKGGFTMLFTGDTSAEDEAVFCTETLKAELPRDGITVLKAAHHGSRTSNSECLLDTFRPGITVISCGRNNRYGHPDEEVLDRLEKHGVRVLQTQYGGALTFTEKTVRVFRGKGERTGV